MIMEVDVGALYQHLSNGGQTDPNPSLNLFGPQVASRTRLACLCHVERSENISGQRGSAGQTNDQRFFASLRMTMRMKATEEKRARRPAQLV